MWMVLATLAQGAVPCQTAELRLTAPPLADNVPAPLPDELQQRDAFDVIDNVYLTEHFAIRWGADDDITLNMVALYGDGLERAWDVHVDGMGYPQPFGTETYYLNAYIGNTGGGAPTISFDGGYVTIDDDGYPFIVMSKGLIELYDWVPEYPDSTVTHEFMHAIQFTVGRYDYDFDSGWFWEAHAEWSVQFVLGDDNASSSVGGYALLPYVSLYHFDYPDSGTLIETHHYGAEVFVTHLSENVADEDLVLQSWITAAPNESPQDAFDRLLIERGSSLDEAFENFAIRNATWDYEQSVEYRSSIGSYLQFYPGQGDLYAKDLEGAGTDWTDAKKSVLPWGLAYNHIRLDGLEGGPLEVGFEGEERGKLGTNARWYASLVLDSFEETVVHPLVADGLTSELTIDELGEFRTAYLVVSQHARSGPGEEKFGYRYKLLALDAPEDTQLGASFYENQPEPKVAKLCHCQTGAGGWLGWLFLVPLVSIRRTRG